MRQDARVLLRLTLVALVLAGSACALDEAELYRAGAPTITADIGQLRVLSYADDPATDQWIDVVEPDPTVFEEGDAFREDDSRTADEDEPAEKRRLFTAVDAGRTLLVQYDEIDGDVLVWELVAGGDDRQPFSDGTDVARADETFAVEPGGLVVIARDRAQEGFDVAEHDGLELVARQDPDDGSSLFVDVFRATAAGDLEIVYDTGTDVARYPITVG